MQKTERVNPAWKNAPFIEYIWTYAKGWITNTKPPKPHPKNIDYYYYDDGQWKPVKPRKTQ